MPVAAPPRVLAIAGSDSSGGAGIQADIKTITMLGGYAMTAITAVTAQNTTGVQAVEALPSALVAAQIDSCLSDIGADAVKIGMLGSPEIAHVVADRLEGLGLPVVFDPVMVATSGSVLADEATVAAFERLMSLSAVVTPNLPELEALARLEIRNAADRDRAVEAVMDRSRCRALLAKGGHGLPGASSAVVEDFLYTGEYCEFRWSDPRIETRHTHGTGCTLSSAIATLLGRGESLEQAIEGARAFVRAALEAAPGFGAGHGPMGHQAVR
jgi:hydroxymethylpyrimidine/phosphomethylpyrimidine kinase